MTVTINGAAPTTDQQADIRTAIGLGTAATTAETAYATAAQGTKADSALQPGSVLNQAAIDGVTVAGAALLNDASVAAQRTTLGLGSAALVASTAAGEAIMTAANAAAQRSALGLGTASLVASTAAGEALMTAASAGAQRTALGLGAIATQPASAYVSSAQVALGLRRASAMIAARHPATTQASAWANGATVVATDIRRLSTGELLICTTGGTTGASEPAYSPSAAITDNTATWWPLGNLSRPAPSGVPVVTVTDNSGSTAAVFVNLHSSFGSFDQPATPQAYTGGGSGSTTRSQAWGWLDGSTSDNGFGANGRDGKVRSISFSTQAEAFDLGYFAIVAGFVNERVQVEVEGYPVTEAPILPGAAGASRYWRFVIPGGRMKRRIRITCAGNLQLTYVGVPSNCTVEKSPVDEPVLWAFTDSYGNTESPGISSALHDLHYTAGRACGFPHVMGVVIGGTSYTIANGSRLGLQALLAANNFSSYRADAIMIAHGFNAGASGSGVSTATESASATSCWTTLRTLKPSAPIVVIGPWWTSTGNSATMPPMGAALKAALLAWADGNSAYIDPLDGSITLGNGSVVQAAAGAWITQGTTSTWAIGADGVHPSPIGRAYLTSQVAAAMDTALKALLA